MPKTHLSAEDLELLRRIESYVWPSNIIHAVYIPPAQQLRNEANRIEQMERDHHAYRDLMASLLKGQEVESNKE